MAFERRTELTEEECEYFGVNKFLEEKASNHTKDRYTKKSPQERNNFTCAIDRDRRALLTQNLKIGGGRRFTYYILLWHKEPIVFLTENAGFGYDAEGKLGDVKIVVGIEQLPDIFREKIDEIMVLIEDGFNAFAKKYGRKWLVKFPHFRKEDKAYCEEYRKKHPPPID